MFTDTQFMTARQKDLVLKDWRRFLRRGLRQADFTKRLYEHLHQHCGFIAHYNIHGFYSEYFEAGQDTERFFTNFCSYTAQNFGACAEYDDLNTAMRQEYEHHREAIARRVADDVAAKPALLEASVLRAKEDGDFAKQFLGKINL